MNKDVLNNVIRIINEVTEVDKKLLNENTNLLADLDIESLDLVDLVVAFEKEYNFEIPDKDIKTLVTIKDIVNYIESHE